MKGKTIIALCGLVLAGALLCTSSMAETIDIGPEEVTMKSLQATKPAEFPHRKHQEMLVCTKCHHLDGAKLEVGKCHSCHNENLGNEDLDSMKEVGHALCKDCHKEQRDAGKEISLKCSTCHPLTIRKPLPPFAQ